MDIIIKNCTPLRNRKDYKPYKLIERKKKTNDGFEKLKIFSILIFSENILPIHSLLLILFSVYGESHN